MDVNKVDMSNPLARKIYDLKFTCQESLLKGNYRDSIKARKELSEIAVDNFDLITKVENPITIRGPISVFSKYRRRFFTARLIDKFRIKTPTEKKYITKCFLLSRGLYTNTPQKDNPTPLTKEIYDLKSESQIAMLSGLYHDSIKARKELAEIGVDHFELVTKIKNPVQGRFGLFSKYGRRILTAILIDKIRAKTPAEKKYIEMNKLFKKGLLKF